jgi:hypothetical protein
MAAAGSDPLECDLLARVQLLIQLRYRQYILLPVLLTALEEVVHTCLQVSHWLLLSTPGLGGATQLNGGAVLASGSCIYTKMLGTEVYLPFVLMICL